MKPETSPYHHNIKASRGLYIKILPSGRKGWFYRYRVGKLFEWMKIGEFTNSDAGMSLSEARDEVTKQRQIVKKHGSAKQYRDAERAKNLEQLQAQQTESEQDAYTVKVMCAEYIEDASRELKSWKEVDRSLKKYVIPVVGDMAAHEVTRKDVIAMLDRLNKRGTPVQANRVLSYVRRVFNWAVNKDKFDIRNPCDRIEPNKEKSKDRALSSAEIRRLIKNMPDSGMAEVYQDLYLFILLTGCRPGEAAGASIDQIDAEAATLTLTNTKNSRTHIVPLSAKALEIAVKRQDESKWLFPMVTRPNQPIRADSIQRPLKAALPKLKTLPFTPHDLRRSFATGLAELQCPDILISLALNHTVQGITSIYNRYSYADELREWFDKWGAHIEALTDKPTELRKSA